MTTGVKPVTVPCRGRSIVRLPTSWFQYMPAISLSYAIINHTVAYRVRFPSAPPRVRCLLSCGVRTPLQVKAETPMKKAVYNCISVATLPINQRLKFRRNACVNGLNFLVTCYGDALTLPQKLDCTKLFGGKCWDRTNAPLSGRQVSNLLP